MEKNIFFAKNLKTYLFAHEVTHEDLAGRLGLKSHGTVGRWINENRVPPGPTLQSISAITGIDSSDFVSTDLTWHIITKSNYTSLLAEPDSSIYAENATIKMMAKYIEETQEQLKLIGQAGEKVLQSAKTR